MNNLAVCLIDNGIAFQFERTEESLKTQKLDNYDLYRMDILDFFRHAEEGFLFENDYVVFIYSGTVLLPDAIHTISETIDEYVPNWFYFNIKEGTFGSDGRIIRTQLKKLRKFMPLSYASDSFIGEEVVFSRQVLQNIRIKEPGRSFRTVINQMTVEAAQEFDGHYVNKEIAIHCTRIQPDKEDINLINLRLKNYIEKRTPGILGRIRDTSIGLDLDAIQTRPFSISFLVINDDLDEYSGRLGKIIEHDSINKYEIINANTQMNGTDEIISMVEKAKGDIICFINSCCSFDSINDIHRVARLSDNPYIGIASPQIIHNDKIVFYGLNGENPILDGSENSNLLRYVGSVRESQYTYDKLWATRKTDLINFLISVRDKVWNMEDYIASLKRNNKVCVYIGTSIARTNQVQIQTEINVIKQLYDIYGDDLSPWEAVCDGMRELIGDSILYAPETLIKKNLNSKTILVISHEMSLTGAPIVLLQALTLLNEFGWRILVISPKDGPLRDSFVDNGIPVLINHNIDQDNSWIKLSNGADLILVNTIVPYTQIMQLEKHDKHVLWWIHDAETGYKSFLRYVLPKELNNNVSVYAVSKYAERVLKKYRPKYQCDILTYGIEDKRHCIETMDNPFESINKKYKFVTVGEITERKGQDILVSAIRILPVEIIKDSVFCFIGKNKDKSMIDKIEKLKKDFPDSIVIKEACAHEEIISWFKYATAVICPSRDDPLPTVMTETMMVGGVCICSQNTGTVDYINNGVNGYSYFHNSPKELEKCIREVVKLKDDSSIREEARRTYEENFTNDIFKQHLISCIDQCMRC